MVNFRPIGNQVVVEMDADKEKSKGGLYLPQTNEKVSKPITGKVIAVGNGKKFANAEIGVMTVKAGDKVLFGKYAGSEVELDDKLYYIMSEDDIMAVIEEEVR